MGKSYINEGSIMVYIWEIIYKWKFSMGKSFGVGCSISMFDRKPF